MDNRQIDGQMDRWQMDGRTDGWMDGWKNKLPDNTFKGLASVGICSEAKMRTCEWLLAQRPPSWL